MDELVEKTTATQSDSAFNGVDLQSGKGFPISQPLGEYQGPAEGITKANAFDQTYEQIEHLLSKDIRLAYVEQYELMDGSVYKG